MAQLMTVRLSRPDAHQPWGLRLQGGKDFAAPLLVQKVNMGSIADQAGLQAGDSLIKVNNVDVFNLRHKDAQDLIVRAGNSFEVVVQRGGSTWRPNVTPTGAVPSPTPGYTSTHVNTVTKTSLAHKQQDIQHIGSGYNNAARPFGAQQQQQQQHQNGHDPSVKSIVNKQYNTPVGIYSEESIAETLSAQAEVLAGGVLGVNFKKNEKVYNSAGSEVLKALQESENEPSDPDEYMHKGLSPVTKHVSAPIDRPAPSPANAGIPPGQNICEECERLIVGVFVRIKDRNLHVECFRCATCGTSLKNQGYFNLNNKLYCDIHAKMAAMANPPPGTEGFKPVPIQPNMKLSANTISAAIDAHYNGSPNLNSSIAGPKPFNYGGGPPQAGPKSPSMYQPMRPQQNNWNKPSVNQSAPQHYGTAPSQNYTPPQNYPPPQNYAPTVNQFGGSNTLPRPAGGQHVAAPPPLPAPTSLQQDSAVVTNDTTKPGYATELLEQSLSKLKVSEREDFRSNAGKVISLMLESRLTDKHQDHKTSNSSLNRINDTTSSTILQPIITDDIQSNDDDFPLPPPPPPIALIESIPTNAINTTTEPNKTIAFKLSPPNFNQILINNNITPPTTPDSGPLTVATSNIIEPSNGHSPVMYRNKDCPSKQTWHARDRRSYIEKDQQQQQQQPQQLQQQQQASNGNENAKPNTTNIVDELSGNKQPVCNCCNTKITQGPFITALGRIWCPDHFVCVTSNCRRPLQDIGFVEERGDLYCEYCFEKYLAPPCDKCGAKIKGDCLNAIGKHFHPECFKCVYCGKLFGNSPFFLEEGEPYCEADWNEMFTTKCFACGFPVEAGDRWVEALSHNYHSQCFNCTTCKKNLEGQSFFAKGGRPYCKNHAR